MKHVILMRQYIVLYLCLSLSMHLLTNFKRFVLKSHGLIKTVEIHIIQMTKVKHI